MVQRIFLSLSQKQNGEDPLHSMPLEGLLDLHLILPQNLREGHFILNLYKGEEFVGIANFAWDGTLEYCDPKAGHYLHATAHLDDITLEAEADYDDAEARAIIIDCMRRCNISYYKEMTQPNDVRAFIVALMRSH